MVNEGRALLGDSTSTERRVSGFRRDRAHQSSLNSDLHVVVLALPARSFLLVTLLVSKQPQAKYNRRQYSWDGLARIRKNTRDRDPRKARKTG